MKTHWKKLDNPNYLGAYSLMDGETKELTATIEKVVKEDVKTERGSDSCRVAYLKGDYKPMILNNTNCKVITKIYNTPYIEDWAGKTITIYVAKIKAFGEQIEALRIKPVVPPLPALLPNDTENWNKVKQALLNGYDLKQIQTRWNISEDNKKRLTDENAQN